MNLVHIELIGKSTIKVGDKFTVDNLFTKRRWYNFWSKRALQVFEVTGVKLSNIEYKEYK